MIGSIEPLTIITIYIIAFVIIYSSISMVIKLPVALNPFASNGPATVTEKLIVSVIIDAQLGSHELSCATISTLNKVNKLQ